MAGGIAAEGSLQDAPLDRIGVLEFIDQGGAVASGHGAQQRCIRLLARPQRVARVNLLAGIELLEQLAVAHLAAALASTRQFGAAPVGEMQQQQLRRAIHQIGDRLQQLGLGQAGALGVRSALQLLHRAGVEIVAQRLHLQEISVAGRLLEARQPAIHAVELVRPGLEPIGAVVDAARLGGIGAGGQVVLQLFGVAPPELREPRPARPPAGLQLGGQGLFQLHTLRKGIELQGRITIEGLQHTGQTIGADAATDQARQVPGGQGQHLLLPVVMHDLAAALGGAALQRHRRPQSRLQGLPLQGAAAEPVNGGDVGAIELLQGQQETATQQRSRIRPLGRQPLAQRLIQIGRQRGLRSLGARRGYGDGFQLTERLLQAAGDAVPQLGGRGVGEGDHQQLFDRQGPRPLAHQPQHQMGQSEGLARAGTGLEQADARSERHGVGLEGRQRHAFTSCRSSSIGPCSARASSSTTGVSSSARG